MSLIKSFNINYFKQNVKKSKGLLLIILLLVPIANFLQIFLSSIDTINVTKFNTAEFMIFNLIGMYIVPFIISVALSGYVYKKKSVDFVNSMPLNRKTIFTTNAIGGILLIIIMQLVNFVGMLLGKLLFNNVIIYVSMMAEIFLQMTISYIFVYMIANIAMSLSGNVITQAIVTALIAFTIPFVIHASNNFFVGQDVKIIGNYGTINGVIENKPNYTLPYGLIINLQNGDEGILNYKITLKMLILSIIYFFIGKYLFEKRKMENTEESFENPNKHLIVKLLTLLPIAYLFEFINGNDFSLGATVIIIVMTTIYWCIYDLITKKKIKFKKSILFLVIGTIVLESVIHISHQIISDSRKELKIINGNDISEISIDNGEYFKDEKILQKIYESPKNYISGYDLKSVNIKLKNGDIVATSWRVNNQEEYTLENDTLQVGLKKKIKDCDKVVIGPKEIKGKEKSELLDEVEKYIDNIDYEGYEYLKKYRYGEEYIELIGYKNHNLIKRSIPIDANNEIFKKATKISNNVMKEKLNNNKKVKDYGYFSCELKGANVKPLNKNYTIPVYEAVQYINNHSNEECSMEKDYYIISSGTMRYYTNDIENIEKLIE